MTSQLHAGAKHGHATESIVQTQAPPPSFRARLHSLPAGASGATSPGTHVACSPASKAITPTASCTVPPTLIC